MVSKTIGFRGFLYFQTHPNDHIIWLFNDSIYGDLRLIWEYLWLIVINSELMVIISEQYLSYWQKKGQKNSKTFVQFRGAPKLSQLSPRHWCAFGQSNKSCLQNGRPNCSSTEPFELKSENGLIIVLYTKNDFTMNVFFHSMRVSDHKSAGQKQSRLCFSFAVVMPTKNLKS